VIKYFIINFRVTLPRSHTSAKCHTNALDKRQESKEHRECKMNPTYRQ